MNLLDRAQRRARVLEVEIRHFKYFTYSAASGQGVKDFETWVVSEADLLQRSLVSCKFHPKPVAKSATGYLQ